MVPPELSGWDFVGTVGIDTGHVLVADPCYAAQLAEEFAAAVDAGASTKMPGVSAQPSSWACWHDLAMAMVFTLSTCGDQRTALVSRTCSWTLR